MHYLGYVFTQKKIKNHDELYDIIKEYDCQYYYNEGQNSKYEKKMEEGNQANQDMNQDDDFNYEIMPIYDGFVIGGRWSGLLVDDKDQKLNICQIKNFSLENTKNAHIEEIRQNYCLSLEELEEGEINEKELLEKFELPADKPLPTVDDFVEQKKLSWHFTPYLFLKENSLISHFDYEDLTMEELHEQFNDYFETIPKDHYIIVVDFHS